jgi:glycosyltransferase involved in cell wall biosynthesis
LVDVAARFDVVVATVWNSVAWLERLVAAHSHVLPAYYVQDYEPLFYPEGSPERAEAAASYTQLPGAVLFAKTRWLQEVVQTHHPDVTVHKVLPSLDHQVYYPRPRAPRQGLRVVAMVRPKTPRRGAERTVRLFGRLQQVLGPAVQWHVFGADAALPDMQALANQAAMTQHGVLRRPQVAELLASCDVFVDLSDYQAFGRTALEAMACGCMPVVPRRGGCDEFAQHGVNAWVVNTDDEQACFDGLLELITQPARVAQMQQAGLETAARYSTLSAALSEYALLEQHAQEWRAKQRQLMLGGLC